MLCQLCVFFIVVKILVFVWLMYFSEIYLKNPRFCFAFFVFGTQNTVVQPYFVNLWRQREYATYYCLNYLVSELIYGQIIW